MKRIISLILVFAFVITASNSNLGLSASADTGEEVISLNVSGKENYDKAFEVLERLNTLRQSVGEQPLKMDSEVLESAMQRAAEISVYYSHDRPDGSICFSVLADRFLFTCWGENIAMGQRTPADVMNSWTNSQGHYENMVKSNYNAVGIGCFESSDGTLCWVQMFSRAFADGVSRSGSVTVQRDVKAKIGNLDLSIEFDKDPHFLSGGDTVNTQVVNTNKEFPWQTQIVSSGDFAFSSSDPKVMSVSESGVCTVNGNGEAAISVVPKFNESLKLEKICIVGHTYKNSCDTSCDYCGYERNIEHKYKTTTKKATLTKNGSKVKKCSVCGQEQKTTIKRIKSVKLSTTSYTYSGKEKKPTVTVKDSAGEKLKKNTDYTVTYSSGRKKVGTYKVTVKFKGDYSGSKTLTFKINPAKLSSYKLSATSYTYNGKVKKPTVTVKNSSGTKLTTSSYTVTYSSGCKNVGAYKVTIKGKGNYSGSKTLTFKINPPKTKVAKITAGKKKLTVTVSKKKTQTSGYQLQYSTSKKFTSSKTKSKTLKGYKTTKYTIKSLKSKKTYYVRVRIYKTVDGKKYYSGWSSYKSKKTK